MTMQMSKMNWPVTTVCGFSAKIDTTPDYQRPAVWSLAQKQLLLDTILRGFDIPKLYWRRKGGADDSYEVVDGQQRLRAIWEFRNNGFALARDAEPVNGIKIAGCRYRDLPPDMLIRFDVYPLDIVVITADDDDDVREMFLRLQNGTSLKAQEKRNAMPGAMRDYVKAVAGHPFFLSCAFSNSRFNFDLVAAQITALELAGGPASIRNSDLNRMYERHSDFDHSGPKARKVKRTLDFLLAAFPTKTPELERYSVVSLYVLASHLLERYAITGRADRLAEWFLSFEAERSAQRAIPVDEADAEFVTYHEKTSHSTDSADSIQWRHDFLLRKFLQAVPDLEQKDDQRLFTHDQRIAIFRRDKGRCKVRIACEGDACEWGAWEADHVVPWSRGGRTVVANGQVACPRCNSAKGNAHHAPADRPQPPARAADGQAEIRAPMGDARAATAPSPAKPVSAPDGEAIFLLTNGDVPGLRARARVDGRRVIVLKGSMAKPEVEKSLDAACRKVRQKLIDTGRLVPSVGGLLTFAEDTAFNSPSSAASVINTCARNGKTSWVLEGSSMTLGEWLVRFR